MERGYYDHVVRDEHDLARIREYVAVNPVGARSRESRKRQTKT
jgi:hypothetical protein